MNKNAAGQGPALSEGLGPLPRVPACPFAVFDEFGEGADDRVQDYAARLVAGAEQEQRDRCARLCEAWMTEAERQSGPEAAGWLHQLAQHMRGLRA